MAPKAKAAMARMALTSLQQPPASPARRQQASLHTMEITVDNVMLDDPNGREYQALRTVVADGNSVAAGAPAQFHGLNTFTPRALAQLKIPQVPVGEGILEASSGMLPPETSRNPYQHISWVWMLVGYGMSQASAKRAADYVTRKSIAVLTQAMLEANVQVPAQDTKTAWGATATVQGDRLKVVRTGAKLAGGSYEIAELFNFKLRLSNEVCPTVRKLFTAFALKNKAVMSIVDVPAGNCFPMQNGIVMPESAKKPCRPKASGTKTKKTIAKSSPKKKPSRRE